MQRLLIADKSGRAVFVVQIGVCRIKSLMTWRALLFTACRHEDAEAKWSDGNVPSRF